MRRKLWGTVAAAAVVLACGAARADPDDQARTVRLIGSAPTAEDPAAKSFVLDLTVAKGDGAFQETVTGWYAGLPPSGDSGAVTGTCVRDQCAIDIPVTNAKLSLTGDFNGPASVGRFALADDDAGKVTAEGAASFAPLVGAVPGVGELAAPDAVTGEEMKSLLLWTGSTPAVGNADPPAFPDDDQRGDLAVWQQAQGEPMTGLITIADLATLRHAAEAARAKAGWTEIGDAKAGWSAAYPAALLSKVGGSGGEHRFSSADGKASLVISIEAPLSDDAFSALADKLSDHGPDRIDQEYVRANGDLDLSYVEAGAKVTVKCRNRAGGLARLVFSRPADQDDAWSLYDGVTPASFQVTDDLKAP